GTALWIERRRLNTGKLCHSQQERTACMLIACYDAGAQRSSSFVAMIGCSIATTRPSRRSTLPSSRPAACRRSAAMVLAEAIRARRLQPIIAERSLVLPTIVS
ncbi:MAG: hypothetical protein WCF50_03610, partial [Pseudolabrys sp.]